MSKDERDYIKYNIKSIKKMLKDLLKLNYKHIDMSIAITLEHRLYYDIYEPWMEAFKHDKNK